MMSYELGNIEILNVKGIDYRCLVWNMTTNDEISRLNNSELHDKESL